MEDKKATCPFCSGEGYVQLVLGGTETCLDCQGTGVQLAYEEDGSVVPTL